MRGNVVARPAPAARRWSQPGATTTAVPDTVTSSIDPLLPTPSTSRETPTTALAPSSSAAFYISAMASFWPLSISSS
jgi:hypothetical protein